MKKIIIVFLCCVLLAGCNTVPPTIENTAATISETVAAKESTDTSTTTPMLSEPTEKEKESVPAKSEQTESDSANTVANDPPAETKLSSTIESTASSTEETMEPEPIITEPVTEEVTPPEVNPTDIKTLVVDYINQYRTEQGDTTATALPGLTAVARYRAKQLITDFSQNSIPDARIVFQYGEFIDMTLYGGTAEDSYYRGYSREVIGKGDWFGMADQMAERIASGFRNSAGHWSYVGSSQYPYIAVGVIHAENGMSASA